MNEYEAFFYYGIRVVVALLGVSLISSLFIERLSDWTFILLGSIVIGYLGIVFTKSLKENKPSPSRAKEKVKSQIGKKK